MTLAEKSASSSSSNLSTIHTGATLDELLGRQPRNPLQEWERTAKWFDLVFYIVMAIGIGAVVTNHSPGDAYGLQLAALFVVVVAYVVFGSRAVRQDGLRYYRFVYLITLATATLMSVWLPGGSDVLVFVSLVHAWTVADRRRESITMVVTVGTGSFIAILTRLGWTLDNARVLLPGLVVSMGWSIGIGLFIASNMRQAIENAELVVGLAEAQNDLARSEREAGVVAERERVAREIHDTLAQGFMAVVTHSQVAQAALNSNDRAVVAAQLDVIESTSRENLAEARELVTAYTPVALQHTSLREALLRHAQRWGSDTKIRVVADIAHIGPLPPAVEVALLRATQEALANARKHAQASAVWITLRGGADKPIRLEVIDDGIGLPADVAPGYGVRGMRERVAAVGGTVVIESGDDGGTVVTIEVPANEPS